MNEQDKAKTPASAGSPASNNQSGIANSNSNPIKKSNLETLTGYKPTDVVTNSAFQNVLGSSTVSRDATGGDRSYLSDNINTDYVDFNNIQGQDQHAAKKLGLGLTRAALKATVEVAKIPGYVAGIGTGVFQALDPNQEVNLEDIVNNEWIRAANKLNEEVNDEYLKVYSTAASQDGFLGAVTSASFWATEGADGLGYLLGAMAPGAIIAKLGIGAATIRGMSSVGGAFTKGMVAGADASAMSSFGVAKNLAKYGVTAKNVDLAAITTANTLFESFAEAGGAMEGMDAKKGEFIKLNYGDRLSANIDLRAEGFISDQEFKATQEAINLEAEEAFKERKAKVGSNVLFSNMAILAGPNLLQTNILYGGVKAGKFVAKGAKAPTMKSNFGEGFGTGVFAEGVWEEGMQSTVETAFSKKGMDTKKDDGFFNGWNPIEMGKEYGEMISSTDGQKAVFLGAFLGGLMNGVGSARGTKSEFQNLSVWSNAGAASASELSLALDNQFIVDDDGNVVFESDGVTPKQNPVAIAKIARALGTNTVYARQFEKLMSSNDSNTELTKKEAADIIRQAQAQQISGLFAESGDNYKENINTYFAAVNDAIENNPELEDGDKKIQIENAEKVKKWATAQTKKMVNAAQAYDALDVTRHLNTNLITGENKNQQFQMFTAGLRSEFLALEAQKETLKNQKEEFEAEYTRLKNLMEDQFAAIDKSEENFRNISEENLIEGNRLADERNRAESDNNSKLKNLESERNKRLEQQNSELDKLRNKEKYGKLSKDETKRKKYLESREKDPSIQEDFENETLDTLIEEEEAVKEYEARSKEVNDQYLEAENELENLSNERNELTTHYKKLMDEAERRRRLTNDKMLGEYLSKKGVAKKFEEFLKEVSKAETKAKRSDKLSELLIKINNTATLDELDALTNDSPEFQEEFEMAVEAKREVLINNKKANTTAAAATNTQTIISTSTADLLGLTPDQFDFAKSVVEELQEEYFPNFSTIETDTQIAYLYKDFLKELDEDGFDSFTEYLEDKEDSNVDYAEFTAEGLAKENISLGITPSVEKEEAEVEVNIQNKEEVEEETAAAEQELENNPTGDENQNLNPVKKDTVVVFNDESHIVVETSETDSVLVNIQTGATVYTNATNLPETTRTVDFSTTIDGNKYVMLSGGSEIYNLTDGTTIFEGDSIYEDIVNKMLEESFSEEASVNSTTEEESGEVTTVEEVVEESEEVIRVDETEVVVDTAVSTGTDVKQSIDGNDEINYSEGEELKKEEPEVETLEPVANSNPDGKAVVEYVAPEESGDVYSDEVTEMESKEKPKAVNEEDFETVKRDRLKPRLLMFDKFNIFSKLYRYITNPRNILEGTRHKISIFATKTLKFSDGNGNYYNAPNQSKAREALDIYNNKIRKVINATEGPARFDIRTIFRLAEIEKNSKKALSDLEDTKEDNNKDKLKKTKESLIKSNIVAVTSAKNSANGSLDLTIEEIELLIKYLPLDIMLGEVGNEELRATLEQHKSYATEEDYLGNEEEEVDNYNMKSPYYAIPLRVQIIDALLTGNIENVEVQIDKQGGGEIMLAYSDEAIAWRNKVKGRKMSDFPTGVGTPKYKYSNVGELEYFREMGREQTVNYLSKYLFYGREIGGAPVRKDGTTMSTQIMKSSAVKGVVYTMLPNAAGKMIPIRLNQGRFTDNEAYLLQMLTSMVMETTMPNTKDYTIDDFLNVLENDVKDIFLSSGIEKYVKMIKELKGVNATISDLLNLYIHNTSNPASSFVIGNGHITVGSLFHKNDNPYMSEVGAILQGGTTISFEDMQNENIQFAFIDYVQKIRKNFKVEYMDNPDYISFVLDNEHLTTNIETDVAAFGNPPNRDSATAYLDNQLYNSDGTEYELSYNPERLFRNDGDERHPSISKLKVHKTSSEEARAANELKKAKEEASKEASQSAFEAKKAFEAEQKAKKKKAKVEEEAEAARQAEAIAKAEANKTAITSVIENSAVEPEVKKEIIAVADSINDSVDVAVKEFIKLSDEEKINKMYEIIDALEDVDTTVSDEIMAYIELKLSSFSYSTAEQKAEDYRKILTDAKTDTKVVEALDENCNL